MKTAWLSVAFFGCALMPFSTHATDICSEDAMIVFDGSGSMAEVGFNNLNEPRIVLARRAMRDSIPWITQFRRLGLIVYGPGTGRSCDNIELKFAPEANAAERVIGEVDALEPDGMTALTESVKRAAETLDYTHSPATVVLVTDGKETCGGRPCALAGALSALAYDLTVHVIGFKVRADFFSWGNPEQTDEDRVQAITVAECLAEKTGGKYVSTETVDELADALKDTLGCQLIGTVHSPTRRSSRS